MIGCCQYATTEKKSDHTLVWSGYGGGLYYAALRRFNLSLLTILLTLGPVMRIVWPLLLFGKRPSFLRQKMQFTGAGNGRYPISHPQLAIDIAGVPFNCGQRQDQPLRNFPVG